MAQGDGVVYNEAKRGLLAGEIDLDGHTLKVALVTGYSPNIDTDHNWADISGDEESGSGYVAGGATLANKAVTLDSGNDYGKLDADDVTWSSLDVGTPSHAILYDDTHASDILIAYWELTTASNGGDYTLQWHADGIITLA